MRSLLQCVGIVAKRFPSRKSTGFRSSNKLSVRHPPLQQLVANQATCHSNYSIHFLSTYEKASLPSSASSSLKNLIKPFLMKCHPDMAKQQNLSPQAQQLNLRAIQNLNAYVNGVVNMLQDEYGTKKTYSNTDFSSSKIQIDFVMVFASTSSHKKATPTTSRRTVELETPSNEWTNDKVYRHTQRQLTRLLRIASLPIPSIETLSPNDDWDPTNDEDDQDDSQDVYYNSHNPQMHDIWIHSATSDRFQSDTTTNTNTTRRRKKTAWEKSRDAFTARIDWNKVDQVHQEAVRDMYANLQTNGLVRNNPKLRQRLLASILNKIRVVTARVTPIEQLVAVRRLLRLLDEHFDQLQLEDFGYYWEDLLTIVLDGARSYNTSPSALYKRRQRKLDTGFSFQIHSDNRVTVRIPVDFYEEELLAELDRNVWDFYKWIQQDTGLESVLR